MSTYFLASSTGGVRPDDGTKGPPIRVQDIPVLALESLDGDHQVVLDGSTGWIRMPGSLGLEMPPIEIISNPLPGVDGGMYQGYRVQERPVFIPIYYTGNGDQIAYMQMSDKLRHVIDPASGAFRIIGKTERDERELVAYYTGGLEGDDNPGSTGLSWSKIGLSASALEPFARDREDRILEFRVAEVSTPFLGITGGTDAPWPSALSSGLVIGSGMQITVNSDVKVYPTLKLTGPMDSFQGTLSPVVIEPDGHVADHTEHQWFVDIPTGVPAGSTLVLVTDPRRRSIRMDDVLAGGSIALGSTLRPFYPGTNTLNVVAPGGNNATRIELSWRELHRSLW